ncbi:MAG TPA: hypothetical protein PKD53_05670 [Chloroflexaceae bacterium]|nr:hypothetical protein [Chloroflexaceae bacterium]
MTDLLNFFPSILLGVMVFLTLILLPLLGDEAPRRRDDRQRTDEIRVPVSMKDEG